jgi:choice-of-anchor B domain-containing protein
MSTTGTTTTRLLAVLVALVAMVAVMAAPSIAHDDGGGKYTGVTPKQGEDFESIPGSRAADHSTAPKGFAPCEDGMAAGTYPCSGVDMLSHVSLDDLRVTFVNDMWGWTDPATKRDYALVGSSEGTAFVDITDAKRPQVLGILPTASTEGGAFWRDIKVYADHAYVVSEHTDHGMQVFDLTQLRDWDGTYTTYEQTAHYDVFSRAHNIAINEDTGYAYVVGARGGEESCDFGLHMIDISDPTAPRFAGCYGDNGYVHDTQCVVYAGPDARYHGSEICFNSNAVGPFGVDEGDYVDIVDVTDKDDPVSLARVPYPDSGYSHQGWLTPDQRYFLHGDEGDEIGHAIGTTTRVWDVSDLTDPQLIEVFENDTTSIDHNLYTQGRYAYAANYTSGLRVYDTRDIAGSGLEEVAFFDVYPENDAPTFEGGAWSNYPYFRQKGVVAVSSIDRGLFILQPRVSRAGN